MAKNSKIISFYAVMVAMVITVFAVGLYFTLKMLGDSASRGKNLNRLAWEDSFTERGLTIPPQGPREGYWGSRLGAKQPNEKLGWIESEVHIPGLLDIDNRGFQHWSTGNNPHVKILILGGSVAFGAYASSIEKTYFSVLGRILMEKYRLRARITVIAAGAWKSVQEVLAFTLYGNEINPDLVVYLDGLNDLTNGATSKLLYGQRMTPKDGSKWTPLYHAHDYNQRVKDYLRNMGIAAQYAKLRRRKMLIILQPSLTERKNLTKIESRVLAGELKPHSSRRALTGSYGKMRAGLHALARRPGVYFLDCSGIFNNEKETTLADLWHFSDPAHKKLANRIAGVIPELTREKD